MFNSTEGSHLWCFIIIAITFCHFLFVIVFPLCSNNNCDLLLKAHLLIDMLSQNFYYFCLYTIWQTKFIIYQSRTKPEFINSGHNNIVIVAYSIVFFMVEFDNYINILSSLAKIFLYFHFYLTN